MPDSLPRNRVVQIAVILGMEYSDRKLQILSLTASGIAWLHLPADVMFYIPSIVTKDLVSRAGLDTVASDGTSVMARVELLKRLRDIEKKTDSAFAKISRTNLASFYDQVSSPNPEQWSTITVSKAANIIF